MFKYISGKWLVAVSGQSDSMALLSMCLKLNMNVMVCIVHHHKRAQADDEVSYVKDFCREQLIECFVVSAPQFKSNFQDSARKFRYQTFAKIVQQNEASGVLIAHHLDDVIETYLWQKKRNHRVDYYGIKQSSIIEGVKVERPLLSVTKKQILEYNKDNNVHFFEDQSNTDMSFSRNKIRDTLKGMSDQEKQAVLDECYQKQNDLTQTRKFLQQFLNDKLDITLLLQLGKRQQQELMWMYFSDQKYPYAVSSKKIEDIIKQLKANHIGMIPLRNNHYLYYQSNQMELIVKKPCHYRFTFDTIKNVKTSFFTILTTCDSTEGVHIKTDDFPITIRNFRDGDKMKVEIGHKKLTTWFNQHKMPWHQRKCWPVVLNRNNEIIYVVGWRCDVNHSTNNPNLFMIK
jgi:tRNA(Ile)-lysidine synthetase-like protein